MGAQLHGFYSLPKPGKHQQAPLRTDLRDACYVLPRGYSSEGPSELESEDVYTYKTPNNTLAAPQTNEQRALDNYDSPSNPGSVYQIPRTFDKNHNALMPSSADSTNAPPPRPPKPSQGSESRWGVPLCVGAQNGEVSTVIPRRNTLPAVENIKLHRGTTVLLNLLILLVVSPLISPFFLLRLVSPVILSVLIWYYFVSSHLYFPILILSLLLLSVLSSRFLSHLL